MTGVEPKEMPTGQTLAHPISSASGFWGSTVDALLDGAGDRLNPILVKETRQALKSRQFTLTFWLLLICAAGWSFLGISLLLPGVYYLPGGRFMIAGYYLILAVPLLLVVPFAAFRSLATEQEDGTYELLSITSLSARQIVTGKLGSALLQMLIYYAALAPCIGFTYLLRGMDIGIIIILLVGTFLVSVLLCALGLVFAGVSRSRQVQAITSIGLLLALIAAGVAWCTFMMQMIGAETAALDSPLVWLAIGFSLTMYATFFALLILSAAAQNAFASENRSTKIRGAILLQMIFFFGWMMFLWFSTGLDGVPYVGLILAGIFWMFYGMLLTGEVAELSPRAMRDLPQSFLGRTFLTWFNPGSATGYVFTMVSFLTFVLLTSAANMIAIAYAPRIAAHQHHLQPFGLMMWVYMAFYLGLGRLVVIGLRSLVQFGLSAVVLIHACLLVAGAAIPTLVQYWLQHFQGIDYSGLQAMNWLWTLRDVAAGTWGMDAIMLIAITSAVAMCALQLILAAREVEAVRMETPDRVLQDES